MLSLKNVNKSFKDESVLKDLSAEFTSGLNFIIGPSGSGKSTLLKLISGMDNDFTGEISFQDKSLKELSSSRLNDYHFNSVGFIWQNFQLINHLTVDDNIRLVLDLAPLSEDEKDRRINATLTKVGIADLINYKVSNLSGGQKQRVAIARALVKNPAMIIADEPTGALDAKSSQTIIKLLKSISKERLVIVVTHDKGLIDNSSNCFELKGGKLEALNIADTQVSPKRFKSRNNKPTLFFSSAMYQAYKNLRGLPLKSVLSLLMLILSSFFMLINFSGDIKGKQDEIYQQLVKEKGDTIRDIIITGRGLAGDKDISSDTSKIVEKFGKDPRIDFIYSSDSLHDMSVTIDGVVTGFKPKDTNTVPNVQGVVAGRMPKADKNEVVVPKSMLEQLNLKQEDVIGKKANIKGTRNNSNTKKPYPVTLDNLEIVGVVDARMGDWIIYDGFVYSLNVVEKIAEQAGNKMTEQGYRIRVKTVEEVMPIVDELNEMGISPYGEFKEAENIINFRDLSSNQGNSVSVIFVVLAIIISLALTIINLYLRKSEYAILKINGFSNKNISLLLISEYLQLGVIASLLFVIIYPLLKVLSKNIFNIPLSNSLLLGILIIVIQGIVIGFISSGIISRLNPAKNLKIGDV